MGCSLSGNDEQSFYRILERSAESMDDGDREDRYDGDE
jgi:hypothetical protein